MRMLAFSYFFPPHGGPGAIRPLKLFKYFKPENFDIEATVISCAESDYDVRDESLSVEIPEGFKVLRTADNLDPLRMFRKKNKGTIHAPKSDFFFLPDNKIWWISPAVKLASNFEKPDIVFATCPPYSAAIAAKKVAEKFGAKLILDFRDSWTRTPNRPTLPKPHRMFNEYLAKKTVLRANIITCVYESIAREMREYAPSVKVAVLPNGYDPEDFPQDKIAQSKELPLKLFYLGTIYNGLNYPLPLLEAIAKNPDVNLTIAGRAPEEFHRDCERLKIKERVLFAGFLPHKESLAKLMESDVAVVFIDSRILNLGQITSKVYEYLGSGKPILACVPSLGEAWELLRKFPHVLIASPDNAGQIEEQLKKFVSMKKRGQPSTHRTAN